MRKKIVLILTLLSILIPFGMAQNSTCSPYSQYGLGELNDNVPNAYRAMGGVGIGLRNNKVINAMQPASYTACDTMTFMFDVAAGASWSNYKDATGARNRANGNLEYVTLQIPIWKQHIAFSAGVIPFSSAGYDITLKDSLQNNYHYTSTYAGSGTISEVYGGLSFNLFDWVAAGANVYYMFGSLANVKNITFKESGLNSVDQGDYLSVSSVRLRYGLQFFHTFGEHSFVLGSVFESKMKLHSDYYLYETNSGDTITNFSGLFETPLMYGVGGSYIWNNRLTVSFDYTCQQWSSAIYLGSHGSYKDRNRYAFGLEYRNNPLGRRYIDRVQWRLGTNVSNSYVKGIPGEEYTISMGVGLPMRNAGTVFNATLEYSHRGTRTALQENNLKLTINAAISETWFFKRRL